MTIVRTNLGTRESARRHRFEPTGTISSTDVQEAIEEVASEASGASASLTYVTINAEASLSNERSLAAGTGLSLTDGGAGSTATFAINDAELLAFAGLTSAANKIPRFTGAGTADLIDFKDEDNFVSDSATAVPSQQSTKAYVDAAIAGVPSLSDGDKGDIVVSGSGATWEFDTAVVTAFAKTILDDADQATVQATLALVPGTNVQAFDADLSAIAALTSAADKLAYATGAQTWALTDLTSFIRTLLDDANAAAALATLTAMGQGRHTIFIPAAAMTSRTTNGAAAGTAEMTTNKNMFKTLDFDTTTQEFAQFEVWFPKSWNLGTVTAQFEWSHPSTTTNFGVAFGLAGVARSNDDAGDVAFGTAVVAVDTGGTTNDIYLSPETAAITIAGTPTAEDSVQFQINRTVADAGDTLAVDARLHGIRLFYTTNAATDA